MSDNVSNDRQTARLSRREILAGLSAAAVAGISSTTDSVSTAQESTRRPRIAAINSIYRLKSHAYHIAGRFLFGYTINGVHHQPPFQLARIFNDQYPDNDMSREIGRKYGVEICETVEQTLGGRSNLDVDAVLLIIEHGEYPANDFGQILYPRHEYFQKIVEVFRASGRSVPVFVDKHLSYDHVKAADMVRTARDLGFGLMAGSSLPVTWRRPELEPPIGTPIRDGLVAFGYDRGLPEIYLFHALETLQCMMERRSHQETGVRRVRCIEGPDVWKAGDRGEWSWKLLDAALARSPSCNYGKPRDNVLNPIAILVDYQDGARGCVLDLPEHISDFNFAGSVEGRDVIAANFYLPAPPGARFFDPLTYNIEQFFQTGRPPYPVERTLLTTTILDLALHSVKEGGRLMEGPALNIAYTPPADSGFFRGRYTDAP